MRPGVKNMASRLLEGWRTLDGLGVWGHLRDDSETRNLTMAVYSSYFSMVQFSAGQRISTYNQMRPLAEGQGLARLVRHMDRARAHDIHTHRLDSLWVVQQTRGLYPPELQGTDDASDHTLTGIRDVALGHIRGLPADDPLRGQVEHFLADVFPGGVGATTSLPYVDQVAAMEMIVARLQGEHWPLAQELGLQRKVRQLGELTIAYRDYVDAGVQPLAFSEVRAARERGHGYLLETVAIILGTYHDSDDAEHVRKRDALMAPIDKMAAVIRAMARARRNGSPLPELPDDLDDMSPGDDHSDAIDQVSVAAARPAAGALQASRGQA
jgi:hypothetical protein